MTPDDLAAVVSIVRARGNDGADNIGADSTKLLDRLNHTRPCRAARLDDKHSTITQASEVDGIGVLRKGRCFEHDQVKLSTDAGDEAAKYFALQKASRLIDDGSRREQTDVRDARDCLQGGRELRGAGEYVAEAGLVRCAKSVVK